MAIQMKWMQRVLLIFFAFELVSCASYFKRKDCESTNWFQYGENVALEGRRLSGDQFITECFQADADVAEADLDRGFKSGLEKYCQPETIFQVGKNGNFFSTEMCVGENLTLLRSRHSAGVLEYCQRSNGYSAGAKGKAYNKICPASLEAGFLPEFNRGRRRYLQTLISDNDKQISGLEREINQLNNDLRFRRTELQRYQLSSNQSEQALQQYNSLNSQVRSLEYDLSGKKSQQTRLKEENRKLQLEIVQLEN